MFLLGGETKKETPRNQDYLESWWGLAFRKKELGF